MNSEIVALTTDTGAKIRILTPEEYDKLIAVIEKDNLKTLFRIAFFTGMRYKEIVRLYDHPEWVMSNRGFIYLNREAQLKVKRTTPERYNPIAPQIAGELPYFFKNKRPPHRKVWGEDLKRWANKAEIGAVGIVPKMTRASIESWMVVSGMPVYEICQRQGHDHITSLRHYQGIAFKSGEIYEIKQRLSGWAQTV